jgi:hypothetical protein
MKNPWHNAEATASIIRSQIGAVQLTTWGASKLSFGIDESDFPCLAFKTCAPWATYVRISYNKSADLYDILFARLAGANSRTWKTLGVATRDLAATIERESNASPKSKIAREYSTDF